jgi:hypothetical protein
LTAPGQQPGEGQGPGPGGPPIAPQEAQPDPNAGAIRLVRDIIRSSRLLANQYPAVSENVRNINNEVQRMMQKLQQSSPSPEPMSPPV